jgi:4-hydroxybenzoate polyprenyltransferase
MARKLTLSMVVILAAILVGCQYVTTPVMLKKASVPDQIYDVTVYWSNPLYYAVLFDIPNDGKEVSMFYTYLTERVGMDTPGEYVDHFKTRIRGYRTLQISELDGTVRGYLMISNLLDYFFYERPEGERIIVSIVDPHLGGDGGQKERGLSFQ